MNSILRIGCKGKEVKKLQEKLIDLEYLDPPADGIFGPGTSRAVKKFQQLNDQVVDGIVGDRTWSKLNAGKPDPKRLTEEAYIKAANELGCELEAIKAVSEVESAGYGFLSDGRPKILYERHWMYRRLTTAGLFLARDLAEKHTHLVKQKWGGYEGGDAEWNDFEDAYSLNHECAIESCSWGRFQIMGFHWERLGYESPQGFKQRMYDTEDQHLEAFVRFVENDKRLLKAIQTLDWKTFARYYNGPSYAVNSYDKRMADVYNRLKAD